MDGGSNVIRVERLKYRYNPTHFAYLRAARNRTSQNKGNQDRDCNTAEDPIPPVFTGSHIFNQQSFTLFFFKKIFSTSPTRNTRKAQQLKEKPSTAAQPDQNPIFFHTVWPIPFGPCIALGHTIIRSSSSRLATTWALSLVSHLSLFSVQLRRRGPPHLHCTHEP